MKTIDRYLENYENRTVLTLYTKILLNREIDSDKQFLILIIIIPY